MFGNRITITSHGNNKSITHSNHNFSSANAAHLSDSKVKALLKSHHGKPHLLAQWQILEGSLTPKFFNQVRRALSERQQFKSSELTDFNDHTWPKFEMIIEPAIMLNKKLYKLTPFESE
ncbi:hypothetical protein CWB96_00045 [Pseudoalteromonas citrea]|uniref:Uncharacterized protein n=1 Tax=Pseudoalteromonas citrea TaxID=43655 RepID=A0A5S3XVC1_9GAMM|nr:hypothetical protein [Pseudoalteromonas citrea]TMP46343.1 hypothetical protein CWB97_02475 [Pseudoalteromonas citrea]TMP63034.1 hypothetical protein CWB96_00045 [Pseudoalteromonas citrea]